MNLEAFHYQELLLKMDISSEGPVYIKEPNFLLHKPWKVQGFQGQTHTWFKGYSRLADSHKCLLKSKSTIISGFTSASKSQRCRQIIKIPLVTTLTINLMITLVTTLFNASLSDWLQPDKCSVSSYSFDQRLAHYQQPIYTDAYCFTLKCITRI